MLRWTTIRTGTPIGSGPQATIAESTSLKMMARNIDSSKEATEIKKGTIPASAFDLATIAKGYKKVPNPLTQMK